MGKEDGMKRNHVAVKVMAVVGVVALVASACGGRTTGGTTGGLQLVTTTKAGTKPVDKVVWAVYRDVNSLDPIYAFDYPENTTDSLLYESLLRQGPDGSIGPGLATMTNPDQTTIVLTLKPGVTFWDGNPVTPADVVYSLDRNTDAKLAGFYPAVFSRVASITATGANEVTIKLNKPDYWLVGELASIPAMIIEKSFALKQGSNYGTPAGKIMGTGAFKFQSWQPGVAVVMVRNDSYWDSSVKPLVREIDIKGAPNDASLTSALETGGINGVYAQGLTTLDQLKGNKAVNVTYGPGWYTDAFIVSNLKGPLGDVRVRQALSLALDRKGLIDAIYKGTAALPRWISNSGTFGYGKSVFQAAYDSSPDMTQDLAKAKQLITDAGATGKSITIGMSSELAGISTEASALKAAAEAIGMKATLHSVSAQNFINFFIDPKARVGIDGFFTLNYGDYAGPEALLATLLLPDGSQNFDGYGIAGSDPAAADHAKIFQMMDDARGTADPNARAQKVADVEKAIATDLPWIPVLQPWVPLITSANLSGTYSSFAYMFAPWADKLGGT
ncbi:MAG: peptide/nickel transport system substrate-binding protein [Chloroflexota bacterium]|jgi:peptide/nickel transport system substrate-binding protein|nr:peptide/nickel transport system substrate-binding protein [Chloroflexota bacterium]